jgi:hypothetical protein
MSERKDDPISDEKLEELNQALIAFVQEGTAPSVEILRVFLKSDRLKIIRGLGEAGLSLGVTDTPAIKRHIRLSRIAYDQVHTGPLDGDYYESAFISKRSALEDEEEPSRAKAIAEIPEVLLGTSDENFFEFLETGVLPTE